MKSGAFFRTPLEPFEEIGRKLEQGAAGTAKLVFVAICSIANDHRSVSFQVSISHIAEVASLQRRTVERRLEDLERLGIVAVERQKLRQAWRYSVPSLSRIVATLSQNVTTGSEPRRVASLTIDKKEEGKAASKKPLTTPQRISLERTKPSLEAEIKRLEDKTYFEADKRNHPELVAELAEKRERLEAINCRLVDSAL